MRPTFFIIGANKCGTSSLYRYLVSHPSVLPCAEKEPNFFGEHDPQYIAAHIDDYFALFPTVEDTGPVTLAWEASEEAGSGRHTTLTIERRPGRSYITGEATASTFHDVSPTLLHRYLPDTKLILVVRDPVERAYSHHRMYQRFYAAGYDREGPVADFETDIAVELEAHRRGGATRYLAPGFYVDLLEDWEAAYGREQILVLTTDDLADASRAHAAMARVETFLGVPGEHDSAMVGRRFNRAKPAIMSAETRRRLTELYHPYNERLERHLGRKLRWQ
jgi:Sulfotransferase family